jgi:hypothetical protein
VKKTHTRKEREHTLLMNLSLDTRKPSGATDQVKICVSETLVNSFYPQRGEAKQLLFKNQDTRLRLENLIPLYSDEEIEGYWLLHLGAEAQIRKVNKSVCPNNPTTTGEILIFG